MSQDIFPVGVVATGQTRWIATPTFPGDLGALSVSAAALNGSTAVDVSCYLMAEDQEIELSQEMEEDTRACDASARKAFGTPEFSRENILHIVDPQGAPDAQGNLALGALPANSTVYLTLFMSGKSRQEKIAENDLVDVYSVTIGAEHISPRQNGKFKREVKTSFTRVLHRAKVVA